MVSVNLFPGPRCHITGDNTVYPAEFVGKTGNPDNPGMVDRYPNAVVAFNRDGISNDVIC